MPAGVEVPLSMLVVFASAKLLSEIFERLGQPGLVGEILAGVLIGPSVLNWIRPNDLTATFAQLGIMFLLFQVGSEIEAAELLQLGRQMGIHAGVPPSFLEHTTVVLHCRVAYL